MRRLWLFFFYLITLLYGASAWSYPEFIGYGYSSCLTCHYNGQGNGPINDYGRAIWAAEIAGRAFAGKTSAESLAASSGFLGTTKLPWWFRPGLKTRELYVQAVPAKSDSTRTIVMQADMNVALLFDKKSDLIFVGSYGYVPDPYRFRNSDEKIDNGISREHYIRWHQSKKLWLYGGMMDKVFGIRTVNHTAYSRTRTGLAQNDQAHGVIAHYINGARELTGNAFLGNMFQDSDLRQKGGSMMFEYEVKQNWRLGTSLMVSSNSYVKSERASIHSKAGLNNGASLLFEIGLLRDTPKTAELKQGYYIYSQAMQKIYRGVHFFFAGQAYKEDIKNSNTDNLKLGTGFVYFPRNRFEFRLEGENTRQISHDGVSPDTWTLQAQMHLSL